MKVTVPSLPKENGVPVKINVILLRLTQANLFLAKRIVLDFNAQTYFPMQHAEKKNGEENR